MSTVNVVPLEVSGSETQTEHHPAEIGVWLFVFADMCIFAMYFGVFVWEKKLNPAMFAEGQATLSTQFGGLNTVVLIISSFFVAKAVHSARKLNIDAYRRFIKLTIFCGLTFLCVKFVEYSDKFSAGFDIATNEFYRNYFSFTGFHLLHVILGLSLLTWLLFSVKTTEQLKESNQTSESVGLYWHMVDLLWVVLFSLIYLVP